MHISGAQILLASIQEACIVVQQTTAIFEVKVKISPLQAMKAHGDVDTRVHIFIFTALGWGRVASPTLGHLYPRGNPQVLIL